MVFGMADGHHGTEKPRPPRSAWVWRGFLVTAAVALLFAVALAYHGSTGAAVGWGVVAAAWLALALWLRGKHLTMEEHEYRRLLVEDPKRDPGKGKG